MTATAPRIQTVSENAFPPVPPPNPQKPLQVSQDTYLIRSLYNEEAPVAVYMNSMVILGREPVIVDTGTAGNRRQWMEDVFGLVDPEDVKWVFISHDDHDHTGNLSQVMELCTNATLVSSWFQLERLIGDINLPLNRVRWVNDGEAFEAGDRRLVAIRPPTFDAPTTRGLYDTRSRVYWAGDSFATPVLKATDYVSELDREFWADGFYMFQSLVSPWHALVDAAKFNAQVDRIAELDISAILNGHSPAIDGDHIAEAIRQMRTLPDKPAAPVPAQAELDAILAAMGLTA